jgi:hypothetical protein
MKLITCPSVIKRGWLENPCAKWKFLVVSNFELNGGFSSPSSTWPPWNVWPGAATSPGHGMPWLKFGTWHHLHLEKRETVELDEVRGATPPKKKSPVLLNLSIMFHLNNFEHGLSNWRGSRLTGKTFLATALDSRAL